ncbi:hypothetical protein C8R45DRAFT_1140785 [Mycena sanguinolenta]|nr:hypothetical protein C8R45DRAFT_1140785 [Mycena sanguinolenta]
MATVGLTGFYRCTDILYHYHESLKNSRDTVQLQKILNRDAILHPRHPLAATVDGQRGIQAYIGTFNDGEARLLFSSAQVDYLRYWMHAMKLTEQLIPLPYSDCMFLKSSIATATPTVFQSLGALSATSKKLGRMNQHLKEHPLLVGRRAAFERVRALWSAKQGLWCAVSFAAWEVDHTALTDVGWALVASAGGEVTEVREQGHLVVEANQKYKKTELEDGAEYETVTKSALNQKLRDLLVRLEQHAGPVFLLSNDASGDVKYLRNTFQIPLPDLETELHMLPSSRSTFTSPPTSTPRRLFILEPAELFAALAGNGDAVDHDLARICRRLRVDVSSKNGGPANVRNAATDAQSLLAALRAMASSGALDAQRDARWPDYVAHGQSEVEVVFPAEGAGGQDLEGCFPSVKGMMEVRETETAITEHRPADSGPNAKQPLSGRTPLEPYHGQRSEQPCHADGDSISGHYHSAPAQSQNQTLSRPALPRPAPVSSSPASDSDLITRRVLEVEKKLESQKKWFIEQFEAYERALEAVIAEIEQEEAKQKAAMASLWADLHTMTEERHKIKTVLVNVALLVAPYPSVLVEEMALPVIWHVNGNGRFPKDRQLSANSPICDENM